MDERRPDYQLIMAGNFAAPVMATHGRIALEGWTVRSAYAGPSNCLA